MTVTEPETAEQTSLGWQHHEPDGLRERKKARARQGIVEVALELFAEHGYEETTLAEIAEGAEVAPSIT